MCRFSVRGKELDFLADCCGAPWHAVEWVGIGPWKEDGSHSFKVKEINLGRDYDVPDYPSLSEWFDRGQLKAKWFEVKACGGSKVDRRGKFKDFHDADEFAKQQCRREIDICERDGDWRPYAAHSVMNNEQLARERIELRHYEYYNCRGHRFWISVAPSSFEVIKEKPSEGK